MISLITFMISLITFMISLKFIFSQRIRIYQFYDISILQWQCCTFHFTTGSGLFLSFDKQCIREIVLTCWIQCINGLACQNHRTKCGEFHLMERSTLSYLHTGKIFSFPRNCYHLKWQIKWIKYQAEPPLGSLVKLETFYIIKIKKNVRYQYHKI